MTPQQLPLQCRAVSRSHLVPLDHRHLGETFDVEHRVRVGEVLGIYIADVLGEREALPNVAFLNFAANPSPPEPMVGHPIKVETDGTIQLPYIDPLYVENKTLREVRDSIRHEYSEKTDLIKPGRDNTVVSVITPKAYRIHVIRQDTRYRSPALQVPEQFEISRKWSGSIVHIEPDEATVLTALLKSGGLPGIDARNEIWVMKRVSEAEAAISEIPFDEKLAGKLPMMFPKKNTKLIRIPLHVPLDQELPFEPEDVLLGDGDVVFLPQRDGDVFLTGGVLGGGRFPLARDRDIDILEAIAIATGNPYGPAGDSRNIVRFRSGPGNVIPPTDAVVIRRRSETEQYKIRVDLLKSLDDPSERLIIQSGDLIVLRFRPRELASNVVLNLFDFGFGLTKTFN